MWPTARQRSHRVFWHQIRHVREQLSTGHQQLRTHSSAGNVLESASMTSQLQPLLLAARQGLQAAAEGSISGRCYKLLQQRWGSQTGPCSSPTTLLSFLQYQHRLHQQVSPASRLFARAPSASTSSTSTSTSTSTSGIWRSYGPVQTPHWARTSTPSSRLGCHAPSLPPRPPPHRPGTTRHTSHPHGTTTTPSSGTRAFSSAPRWQHALEDTLRCSGTSFGAALRSSGTGLEAAWRQLALHCPDWLSRSSSTATITILNALNLVNGQLPKLIGIMLAEFVRCNPLLSGAKADAGFQHYVEVPEVPASSTSGEMWIRAVWNELLETVLVLQRLLWIFLLFLPVAASAPLALSLDFKRAEWMELLRKSLEAAGPAFIKWGQWAATRLDIFPPDMCQELEHLHTQAPAHRFKHTKSAIEAAFGLPLTELFESIEEQPVASGSIGQIHRAVLAPKGSAITGVPAGTTVAVKVRHPGVGAAIMRDFGVMVWLAAAASVLPALSHLRLEDTLKQFAAPLREQVDLSREAHNLWRFNYNFRRTRHVEFPEPLFPLVSSDVLVESYEHGDHIALYLAQASNPHNSQLASIGSGTMLQMMLVDNLIHSDLHPGNILVRLEPPAGLLGMLYRAADRLASGDLLAPAARQRVSQLQAAWLRPKMILLDVGMATELTNEDQTNMLGLFRSFAALDGTACGEWVLRFSGREQACPDPGAFKEDLARTFEVLKQIKVTGWGTTEFNAGADVLAQVLELVRQHRVSLPGHICAVVVTTLILEGWSNKLDPDHSVLSQVQVMFEGEARPWRDRILHVVDDIWEEEAGQLAAAL